MSVMDIISRYYLSCIVSYDDDDEVSWVFSAVRSVFTIISCKLNRISRLMDRWIGKLSQTHQQKSAQLGKTDSDSVLQSVAFLTLNTNVNKTNISVKKT